MERTKIPKLRTISRGLSTADLPTSTAHILNIAVVHNYKVAILHWADWKMHHKSQVCLKPGLHFERKSTAHTQTILRTWGAFSRPPMPIYAVGIAQVPSVNTPTIRRLLRVDAGLSLVNSPQHMRIRKLLRDI